MLRHFSSLSSLLPSPLMRLALLLCALCWVYAQHTHLKCSIGLKKNRQMCSYKRDDPTLARSRSPFPLVPLWRQTFSLFFCILCIDHSLMLLSCAALFNVYYLNDWYSLSSKTKQSTRINISVQAGWCLSIIFLYSITKRTLIISCNWLYLHFVTHCSNDYTINKTNIIYHILQNFFDWMSLTQFDPIWPQAFCSILILDWSHSIWSSLGTTSRTECNSAPNS